MSTTNSVRLTPLRLIEGTWEGLLSGVDGDHPPALAVTRGALRLDAPDVEPREDGSWLVRVTVPAEALSEGMQVFVISLEDSDETIADFAVLAGDVLRNDIRAEVELLRAELDMLKRAFRKHCRES